MKDLAKMSERELRAECEGLRDTVTHIALMPDAGAKESESARLSRELARTTLKRFGYKEDWDEAWQKVKESFFKDFPDIKELLRDL
jgi:hypothetical protein